MNPRRPDRSGRLTDGIISLGSAENLVLRFKGKVGEDGDGRRTTRWASKVLGSSMELCSATTIDIQPGFWQDAAVGSRPNKVKRKTKKNKRPKSFPP